MMYSTMEWTLQWIGQLALPLDMHQDSSDIIKSLLIV